MKTSLRNEHISFSRHVVTDGGFTLTVEINKKKGNDDNTDYKIFVTHLKKEENYSITFNLLREFPIYIKLLADIDLILRRELKFKTKGFTNSVIDLLTEPPGEDNETTKKTFKERICNNCQEKYIPTSGRSLYCDKCAKKMRG